MLFVSKSYDNMYIKGRDSNKSVVFSPACWASFRLCLGEIDSELRKQKRVSSSTIESITVEDGTFW